MDAKLIINDVEVVLGHKGLEEIAFMLEDKAEYSDVYHELARSEYSEILVCLVDKEHLSRLTLRMLIENDSPEVMRAVLDSRRARRHMTRRDLETYMDTDDRAILIAVANNMDDFTDENEICEKSWLCQRLVSRSDPSVRFALAENPDTPEEFLERLAGDDDVDVARQAEETLAEIREEDDDEDIPL